MGRHDSLNTHWNHMRSMVNVQSRSMFNPLAAKLFNLLIIHMKLCLANSIHSFKWVKIIQIWQNVPGNI